MKISKLEKYIEELEESMERNMSVDTKTISRHKGMSLVISDLKFMINEENWNEN